MYFNETFGHFSAVCLSKTLYFKQVVRTFSSSFPGQLSVIFAATTPDVLSQNMIIS